MADSTRTRTRRAREERREQIVDAAAEVFRGRDPAEVTFEEIADAAGVSRALVYNYFGDRSGLVEAVYKRNVGLLAWRVGEALATTKGRENALRALVEVHVAFAEEDPAGYRYAAGEPAFARLPELEDRRVATIAANFGGSVDAHVVSRGWLSAVQTMVIYWLDHPDGVPAERLVELVTAFLRGAIAAVDALGVALTPRWRIPD
jgi:AcrR family transcriptional regulator